MDRKPLEQSFYQKPTLQLAQSLLGKLLVKETKDGVASGWIVETEAYLGAEDRAAHSFGNRRTKRTEIMYHEAGHVYTYSMHTHCLVNVVSGAKDVPEAILIRAVEPYEGIDLMYKRRGEKKKEVELTNGPGKLTKALGITMEDYGKTFFGPPIYILDGPKPASISKGPRIGIDNSGEARDYPYRFWVSGNRFVSR